MRGLAHLPRRLRRPRGQVMLYVVMILLVLLVVCFFLFDLQQVIRLRLRTQNGADAAALTAAAWQGRTLNTIGELNLLKAAVIILTEIPLYPDADPSTDELLDSVALLTQLQTRLTYVGPLVGLAAAQVAAKNNGLRPSGSYDAWITSHVLDYLDPQGGSIYEGIYGADGGGLGYAWIAPYEAMLLDVAGRGIAALPENSRYLHGLPELLGPGGGLLLDVGFYDAVHGRDYCWFYYRGLTSDSPPIDAESLQFQQQPLPFFPGSEYLPLYVRFGTVGSVDPAVTQMVADRGQTPLPDTYPGYPEIVWAQYDNALEGWGDTYRYQGMNQYLRSDIRAEYTYAGAAVRMRTQTEPELLSGRWTWQHGEPEQAGLGLGATMAWSNEDVGGANFSGYAARLQAAEQRLAALRGSEAVLSVTSAKAFGQVAGEPPHRTGIILPVFATVRLIPVELVTQNLADADPSFYRFLVEYFGHPDFPNVPEDVLQRHAYYLNAIAIYNDMQSNFRLGWAAAEARWRERVAGPDLILGTDDDRTHPCEVHWGGPGGGPGSRGGPGIIH